MKVCSAQRNRTAGGSGLKVQAGRKGPRVLVGTESHDQEPALRDLGESHI